MAALNIEDTGGYDCHWVEDPPDDLKCLVCLLVARDPQQHGNGGCGKVFCQTCVTKCLRKKYSCPNCRKQLTTFKDERSTRHIKALKVKCNNIGNGCQWVNELGSLDNHLQTCDYSRLLCPNLCTVVRILRMNIHGHLESKCPRRQFPCQYCNENGEYEERITTHLKLCQKVKVKCPNDKCRRSITRSKMSTHRSTCLYEVVFCKYSEVGYGETPLRKDLNTHEEDHQLHLSITMDTVLKQSKKIAGLKDKISSLERERTVDQDKMVGLEDKISSLERERTVDQDKMAGLDGKISSLERERTVDQDKIAGLDGKISTQNSKLIKHTSLSPFKFKVTNYLEKKKTNKIFYSPPFYTSINGYKMCVRVYVNGSGLSKGSHVSVFAHLMKGDNDDSLTWPFTGLMIVELLNQLEDKNHHILATNFPADNTDNKRVVDGERSEFGWGRPQFIPHTKLGHDPANNCQYLKDDTLIFHVTVEVPDHKPWLECAV